MPSFLIIGAAKSGTTALHHYLRQHPDVFMPDKKELRYFSHRDSKTTVPKLYLEDEICSLEEYKKYFLTVKMEKAIGEASPMYLYYEIASRRIKSIIPEAKLIAILRNPIERAYSAYLHAIRDWREPANNFYEALALEPMRIQEDWSILYHYINAGLYAKQVVRYFDIFPSKNLLFLLYDDFLSNPIKLCQEIFSFLNVNPDFIPEVEYHPNMSGKVKHKFMHSLIGKIFIQENPVKSLSRFIIPEKIKHKGKSFLQAIIMEKQKMPDEYRMHLRPYFVEDIKKLQDLLGRDLSLWIK